MSDTEAPAEKALDVRIGGEGFQLSLGRVDTRLLHLTEKALRGYADGPVRDACRVEVIPYFHYQAFPWEPACLDRFRDLFLRVHARFPPDDEAGSSVRFSLKTLQYMDPGDETMRRITASLEESDSLIYARVGFDLFFMDTKSNVLSLIIKKRIRQSLMVMGIMNGLMFAMSHLLMSHGGLLLHGAAVQKDDETVLFLGPSGAGKSTMARLCKPDVCFSDDGVIIRREGNAVYAYRSPFRQAKERGRWSHLDKGQVRRVFLLEKGREHKVLPLPKSDLMGVILLHLIHFFKFLDDETTRKGVFAVKEMMEQLPVHRLQFAKRRTLWHTIF
jgi:hypothetical protein